MKRLLQVTCLGGAAVLLIAGCKKTDDNALNFTSAINAYYSTHPACLWDQPLKFPVQVTTSDTAKTAGYDALVDQGLLVRTTAEKKVFIIASKQVTNYDISDQGRSAWTADATQPGFGNFCYGHRSVSAIDSSTPTTDQPGATTTVVFHRTFTGVPGWASAPETQNAFPDVRANLTTPQTATATLINTNAGWQMETPASTTHKPVTGADGRIVE